MSVKPHFEDEQILHAGQLNELVRWTADLAGRRMAANGQWGLVRPAWMETATNILGRGDDGRLILRDFWMLDREGVLIHVLSESLNLDARFPDLWLERRDGGSGAGAWVEGSIQLRSASDGALGPLHTRIGSYAQQQFQWTVPALTIGAAPELATALRGLKSSQLPEGTVTTGLLVSILDVLPSGTPTVLAWAGVVALGCQLGVAEVLAASSLPTVEEVVRLCDKIRQRLASDEVLLPMSFAGEHCHWSYDAKSPTLSKLRIIVSGVDSPTIPCHVKWDDEDSAYKTPGLSGPAGERFAELKPPKGIASRVKLTISAKVVAGGIPQVKAFLALPKADVPNPPTLRA